MLACVYNDYICIMRKIKRSKRERRHLIIKRIVSLLILYTCGYLAYGNYNAKEIMVLGIIIFITFLWSFCLFDANLDYRKDYSDER